MEESKRKITMLKYTYEIVLSNQAFFIKKFI